MGIIIILVVLLLHFIVAAIAQRRLINSNMFNLNRVIVNSILIWLIPFVWAMIIVAMTRPTEGSIGRRGNLGGIDGDSFPGGGYEYGGGDSSGD